MQTIRNWCHEKMSHHQLLFDISQCCSPTKPQSYTFKSLKSFFSFFFYLFQLFWTPDVIIHDLVSFNKPEILNQVGALGTDSMICRNISIIILSEGVICQTNSNRISNFYDFWSHKDIRPLVQTTKFLSLEIFKDGRVYYKVR